MYIFDLGSGLCLTDRRTKRARTYAVIRSGPHADAAGGSVYCLWLGRTPRPMPDGARRDELSDADDADDENGTAAAGHDVPFDVSVANEIQLALVAKGLERRFGPQRPELEHRPVGYDV
jgi:hypothetical protein